MSATTLLDDFLDSIEGLSEEVRGRLEALAAKDVQLEEERRALFKKRVLYLKSEEKGVDAQLRASLLRKIDKEHARLTGQLRAKAEEEAFIGRALAAHLQRLEAEISAARISLPALAAMGFEDDAAEDTNPYDAVFEGFLKADPETASSPPSTAASALASATDSTPAPRNAAASANAPVAEKAQAGTAGQLYCHCRQPTHGDMVACDAPGCALEWFHYACVGLTAPPAGRWFCSECLRANPSLS